MPRKPDARPEDISLLIVEDNPDQLAELTTALKERKYNVTGVDTGQAAIDLLLSDQRFDLLILNYVMPGMDGYQVLEKLKELEIIDILPIIMSGSMSETEALVRCLQIGADDYIRKPIDITLLQIRIQAALVRYEIEETGRNLLHKIEKEKQLTDDLLSAVIPIGVALSAEKDFNRLLEKILLEARRLCNADAGTLYLRTDDDLLKFVVLYNDTLNVHMGGTSPQLELPFPPLRMYEDGTGAPNHRNVATHVALTGQTFNIADVYSEADEFDFSGTLAFDRSSSYHSKSFLTVPLVNIQNRVIGVLQMINAKDLTTGEVVAFEPGLKQITESLAALAAVALEAYLREASLRRQIEQLKIEIDEVKRQQAVQGVTQTAHFKSLKEQAQALREAIQRGE